LKTPAAAAPQKTSEISYSGNLISPLPDTDLRDFLDEVDELLRFAPQIIEKIEQDLDSHALQKKRLREQDREFLQNQTAKLPSLDLPERDPSAEPSSLALQEGRPRMPSVAVFLYMMLRGFLGSLTSKSARRMILESISLDDYLHRHGLKRSGDTTILENVNAVSFETRNFIMDRQIELVLHEELDDFKKATIDSTSVKANSSWPTDGKILIGLLERAHRLGQQLHTFGLEGFRKGWLPHWLEKIHALEFKICLIAGKPKSRGKMKKHYRQLLKRAKKAAKTLACELSRLEENLEINTLPPSRRKMCLRVLAQIRSDITDAKRVIEYADDRVFNNITLPSTEKIMSLSDGSAAYIKKGGREAVIGYKPQLVRSAEGFVTSLIVPEGNAADSSELEPAIRESIRRTGVIAQLVSTDDGYSSAKGRAALLDMGVEDVSISGAKGRKITSPADWESEKYREARRQRSAVESLMFTIKDGYEFGKLGRRGIEAVRQELSEKVLAYNSCRIVLIRKRRKEERQKAKEEKRKAELGKAA
jgi:IS5 family transposase